MIKITLLGLPQPKQSFRYAIHPSKEGKPFVSKYQPKKVVQNERNMTWDIKSQLASDFKPFDCPIGIRATFVFPPLKSWSKSEREAFKAGVMVYKDTKPDLDNIFKSLGDSMEGLVYINDSRICEKQTRKIYGEVPKIEIEVWALNISV